MHSNRIRLVVGALVFFLACQTFVDTRADDHPLLVIDKNLDVTSFKLQDARVTVERGESEPVLRLATGHSSDWPGITFKPKQGVWDLSSACYLEVKVCNKSSSAVTIGLRADSIDAAGHRDTVQKTTQLPAGAGRTLQVDLLRKMPARLKEKLFGMRGYPGHFSTDHGIAAGRVDQVVVFIAKPKQDHVIEIAQLQADGNCESAIWSGPSIDGLFPMIDRFGQYMHKDWPGKTHGQSDLKHRKEAESTTLAAHPGPRAWDRYGGWRQGPKLAATGNFRAQQYQGKWWLVDPDGRLFWSHGIDCVHASNGVTPITDRRFYFADLPTDDSPLAVFYGQMGRAPHGYYAKDGTFDTYNFSGANVYRKYGADWRPAFDDLCHRRLRSWGLNTIGNWSRREIYRMQRTPYVVTLGSGRQPIEGSTGYWGKFPDPFAPSFETTLRANARRSESDILRAWCLGVFVDNELAWGDELSLATATLASPATQPAKRAAVEVLKKKYGAIAKLNTTWGTTHASWDALLHSQQPPSKEKAHDDLAALYTRIAEKYFQVCHDAVKRVAPNKLYLGCRFASVNDRAVRAAANYCDVIGFNKYADSVADFQLPSGVDAPAIIGEFHFGALDRGMFHTGLRGTKDQNARAAAYTNYVRGALRNRYLVGTHWFQFGDQPTTGRFDGENYQIGFVDICDTPYPEIVAASQAIGAQMYALRMDKKR